MTAQNRSGGDVTECRQHDGIGFSLVNVTESRFAAKQWHVFAWEQIYKEGVPITCRSKLRSIIGLPFKRKSRGRSKGGKGSGATVQCAGCGQIVPRDKAKRSTRRISLVDYALAKELRQKGTYIASSSDTRLYCVSCAVHRGIVKVRAEKERHMRQRRF